MMKDSEVTITLSARYRRCCRFLGLAAFATIFACTAGTVHGKDDASEFDRVRQLLESQCLACHNDTDRKGDFSLQSKSALIESGFVTAGDAADSHLLSTLTAESGGVPSMPKDGEPLTDDEVRLLHKWIGSGMPWPDGITLQQHTVDDFNWWSFQPIRRPAVPAGDKLNDGWQQSPIDAFIARQHAENGVKRSEPADRRTLIRRITYDLTGLPPTPEEIRAFVADDSPDAYEQLVERLLASPQYGERWARHWLDVVKYADTCGYDKDKLRPNAWPYRDYVIRSFNNDKPYARFVQEQIAGDALFPEEVDAIPALGFISAGPWDFIGHVEVPEEKIDGKVARNLDRDDMVSNAMNTFCSITIQCARCHNHKFDPFTQEHYYSLQSVFAAVDRADRLYDTDPAVARQRHTLQQQEREITADLKAIDDRVKTDGGKELAAIDQRIADLESQTAALSKPAEFGYHSQISSTAAAEKWVEVDLGDDVEIATVVLHPCHDDYAGIGAGFGFPVRFRVEAFSDRPGDTESKTEQQRLVESWDFTKADYANPGLAPVAMVRGKFKARRIRITATHLATRKNDYHFALAELRVLDASGSNVAAGAKVTALDSVEAPPRWRKSNLTDGIWPQDSNPQAAEQLADAHRRRTAITARTLTPVLIARQKQLQKERNRVARELSELPQQHTVYAASTHFKPQGNFKPTAGTPRTVSVLHRGNVQQPGQSVSPGVVPLSEDADWQLRLPSEHSESDRRAALAQWITDHDNPLTWRSIANRIWQYHFGKGLVDSPNDLGRMGQLPTHPELLDWLADEFRRTQSFKHMHRLIVNSATYQQASQHNSANAAVDSDNQYLWRMNRRRLTAEELRDSILAVSGRLNLEMGGPGFYLFELEKADHSPHYEYHKFDPDDPASHRRSVYRFIVRSQPDPFMTTLDCADSSQSTPRRNETLTSLQALSLLNNSFNLAMANHFAARVADSKSPASDAFTLATGREPTDSERAAVQQYSQQHGLSNLCRVLFNLSEFVFVD